MLQLLIKSKGNAMNKPVKEETPEELKARALALYTPPFTFEYGYVHDANGNVVADNSIERDEEVTSHKEGNLLLRVRGWGRIQKFPNPENLQDCVGELICEALNEYWEKQKGHAIVLVVKGFRNGELGENVDTTIHTTNVELKENIGELVSIARNYNVFDKTQLTFKTGESIAVTRCQIDTILLNLDMKKIVI